MFVSVNPYFYFLAAGHFDSTTNCFGPLGAHFRRSPRGVGMRPSASTASLDDAAASLTPLRRVRVDLVDLRAVLTDLTLCRSLLSSSSSSASSSLSGRRSARSFQNLALKASSLTICWIWKMGQGGCQSAVSRGKLGPSSASHLDPRARTLHLVQVIRHLVPSTPIRRTRRWSSQQCLFLFSLEFFSHCLFSVNRPTKRGRTFCQTEPITVFRKAGLPRSPSSHRASRRSTEP